MNANGKNRLHQKNQTGKILGFAEAGGFD